MPDSGFLRGLGDNARRKRNRRFVELLSRLPQRSISILDVGGTVEFWKTVTIPQTGIDRIVLLNTFEQSIPGDERMTAITGDARDLSRFPDQSFDLVFSNSVIGHVGSLEDQRRMAAEVQRVGIRHFLQTPNQGFPIDWRTMVPFFHFLPVALQAKCFARFPVGTYQRARDAEHAMQMASRIRNLSRSEVRMLFPSSRIENETVLGFTKSFLIHNIPE